MSNLYAFYSSEDFRLKTVENSELWFSYPHKFNDLHDCKIENFLYNDLGDQTWGADAEKDSGYPLKDLVPLFKALYEGGINARNTGYLINPIWKHIENWCDEKITGQELYNKVIENSRSIGVRCFAESFDNPLMWAHYAEANKGYCVEYAKRGNGKHITTFPVQYVNSIGFGHNLSTLLFDPARTYFSLMNTKHSNWAYEKETRYTLHKENYSTVISTHEGFSVSLKSLDLKTKAIYVGVNATEAMKCELKKAVDTIRSSENPECELRQMKASEEFEEQKLILGEELGGCCR